MRHLLPRTLLTASLLAASALAAPQGLARTSDWTPLPDAPHFRADHAMAYHEPSGELVVVGGASRTGYWYETWTLAGGAWSRIPTSQPEARLSTALVGDPVRGVLVLFGGVFGAYSYSGPTYLGDTWEWDGDSWQERAIPGPSARAGHAMAYDERRGVVVLFGGVHVDPFAYYSPDSGGYRGYGTVTYFGDTWEFDGVSWTQAATTGPSPRSGVALAYDAHRRKTVLFGGLDEEGAAGNETWEWDGTTWRQVSGLPAGRPAARYAHAMAYDPDLKGTVLTGGLGPATGDGTWVRKNGRWSRAGAAGAAGIGGPGQRWAHAMAYSPSERGVVLLGGWSGSRALADAWLWRARPGAFPPRRR